MSSSVESIRQSSRMAAAGTDSLQVMASGFAKLMGKSERNDVNVSVAFL